MREVHPGPVIGRGLFSVVREYGPDKVHITSSDPAKECMSLGWMGRSTFLPKIKRLSCNGDETPTYVMRRYDKMRAPKQQLNDRAYRQYMMLRELYARKLPSQCNYSALADAFDALPRSALRSALRSAIDGLASYGFDIGFEISPRNIAASNSGNLVLLDVFFLRSAVQYARATKRRRSGNYQNWRD